MELNKLRYHLLEFNRYADGNGVVNVILIADGEYASVTIHYTDGSSETLSVNAGEEVPHGAQAE